MKKKTEGDAPPNMAQKEEAVQVQAAPALAKMEEVSYSIQVPSADLREFLELVVNLGIAEVQISVDKEGSLGLMQLDPSQIAMVSATLQTKICGQSQPAENTVFNMDGQELARILKGKVFSSPVIEVFREGERIAIRSEGEKEKAMFCICDFPSPKAKEPTVKMTHAFAFDDADKLAAAVRKASLFSSHAKFDYIPQAALMVLRAVGDAATLAQKVDCTVAEGKEMPAATNYPLSYLSSMLKVAKKKDVAMAVSEGKEKKVREPRSLTFEFGKNVPCKLSHSFAGGRGKAAYWLAPRIDEE